jgi:hypothetical protein
MEDTITTTYYIHDEFLKATVHRDDSQTRLSSAEVMTVKTKGFREKPAVLQEL